MSETYEQMKSRIDMERSLRSVWSVEEIAAQEQALRDKWVEEFGTAPPEPVTHLYREEGTSEANDSTRDFPPFLEQSGATSEVEPLSQQPKPAVAAVKTTTAIAHEEKK